jgi:putative acetyltransferase
MPEYRLATTIHDYETAAQLFGEYAAFLQIDLGFQHFAEELSQLQEMYAPEHGGIILCEEAGVAIGCVALRRISPQIAELKRMYLRPEARGRGYGKPLLEAALALAVSLHYTSVRLDTLQRLEAALQVYRKNGFYEIPAYYFNPLEQVVYMQKDL